MLRYPRGLRAKHVPRLTAVHRSKVARPNPGAPPGDQVIKCRIAKVVACYDDRDRPGAVIRGIRTN